ncbi:hypothetical protein COJ01_17670 [Priestia megaterium]|jgi:hypothetical protein|uniref:hypothetical protein n=1 Tax=Priestia megaterium TaxID=1404 RepID=UPI000BF4DD2E|nr:hypothetical protein [Priestia megaterium]PFK99891.1 hypothetical protein COJ01_17670 [Priestia megaterium]
MTTTENTITKDSDVRFTIENNTGFINKELGIRKVKLFKPTAKQQNIGIVTTMLVDAGIGETKVVVFNSKENSGDLYLRGPQSKGVVNGQIKFFDDVKINKPSQDFLLSLLDNYIEKESVERIKLR